MGKYEIITKKGYDFFECSSALQKCIRRGMEDEALYWAVELYESNFSEYIWKRLRIMSSEDVGLADPTISSEIWALYCMFEKQSKKKDDANEPQRLFLTHAVLLLCRSKKSRLVDWALIWAWLTHPFKKNPIPDFAYDKHNDRGRRAGRGWKHFFEEGALLMNQAEMLREEEFKERAKKAISDPSGMSLF